MHRRGLFLLPLILTLRRSLYANLANGDPRKEKLFSMFIAPCCWRENLLVHHSPKADELRAEITNLVAAGRNDDEIKKHFIGQFSLRILAEPEGTRGQWLSWTPGAAVLAGLALLALFIKRSLRKDTATKPTNLTAKLPDLPESEWN